MRSWRASDKSYYVDVTRQNLKSTFAAGELGFDPQVIGCPDWDVGDLIAHAGSACTFWNKWIRERPNGPGPETRNELTEEREQLLPGFRTWAESGFERKLRPADVMGFARTTAGALLQNLEELDPADEVWTFYEPDHTAAFWFRRIAMETTVHLLDAERAHGIERAVDVELAGDNLDEYLNIILRLQPPGSAAHEHHGESFLFSPTDGQAALRASFPGTDVDVTEGATTADVQLTGSSTDLLLFVWGRAGLERVQVSGDESLAGRWNEFAGRF